MSRHGYEPAILSGRKVYWCPSYEGHLAFCPQPTDPDTHIFCCKSFYLGQTEKPSCCMYALPIGTIVALILSCIILLSILIFFACWCLPCCPLNKKMAENQDINEENEIRMKSCSKRNCRKVRCNITWKNLKKLKTEKITNFLFDGEIINDGTFIKFLELIKDIDCVFAKINMDLPVDADEIFMKWLKNQCQCKKLQIFVIQTYPLPTKRFSLKALL